MERTQREVAACGFRRHLGIVYCNTLVVMATKEKSRKQKYQDVLAAQGRRLEDCKLLAFVFGGSDTPAKFHFGLMLDVHRPKYYLFDSFENYAQIIAPKDDAVIELIRDIAGRAGGKETTPILI